MNDTCRMLTVVTLLAAGMLAAGCTPPVVVKKQVKPQPMVVAAPGETKPVVAPKSDKAAAARFESLLNAAAKKVDAAKDVKCRLVRREMVKGSLQPEEVLDFRQRFTPHALHIKWMGERFKDRDLIYAAGENDNQVLVKAGSTGASSWLTGNRVLRLSLDSPSVKGQSRYGPDVAGYNNLVARLVKLYREARPLGLAWVEQLAAETSPGRTLQKFDVTLEPVLLDGDVSSMTIWFDSATSLPVHTMIYDAQQRLVEDYDWQDLRLGAGLTDADFRFETEP